MRRGLLDIGRTGCGAAMLAFASLAAIGQPASAQPFENAEWRFVGRSVEPALEDPIMYTDRLLVYPDVDPHIDAIVERTYPTNIGRGELGCQMFWPFNGDAISFYPLDGDFIDDLLATLTDATSWLTERGFDPIHTYARMPEYTRATDPITGEIKYTRTGPTVNLVGCRHQSGFVGAQNAATPNAAFPIRISAGLADLRDANPTTFRMTTVHEFMHVYQHNLSSGTASGRTTHTDHWVNEALPDLAGLAYLSDRAGGYDTLMRSDDIAPFDPWRSDLRHAASIRYYQARPYYLPLNLQALNAGENQTRASYSGFDMNDVPSFRAALFGLIGYQTLGFWNHVTERYFDGDIVRTLDLYKRLDVPAMDNVTRQVDLFLNENDGPLKGLEHVLPQFLAEYEGWWDDYINYNGMTEALWNLYGFDTCRRIELTDDTPYGILEIDIATYAGRCIDVVLTPEVAALSPEIQMAAYGAEGSDVAAQQALADHLYLGFSRLRGAATLDGSPTPPADPASGDVTCFNQVERGRIRVASGETCLLDPRQGVVVFNATRRQVQARTFNISEVSNLSSDEITIRLILTHAPTPMIDIDLDMMAKPVVFVATLDFAGLKEESASGPGSQGNYLSPARLVRVASLSEAGNAGRSTGAHAVQTGSGEQSYIVTYGLRGSRGPISPNTGGVSLGAATTREIFTGAWLSPE